MAQTSLRIHTPISDFVILILELKHFNWLHGKFQSVVEQTGLSLTQSEKPKTGFLAMRPISIKYNYLISYFKFPVYLTVDTLSVFILLRTSTQVYFIVKSA